MAQIRYWVWLTTLEGLRSISVTRLLETFGVPDTPRFTMDVEYRSLFGKKRSKTLFFAVLDGTPEK